MDDNKFDSMFKTTFSGKSAEQEEDHWDAFEIKLYKDMFYKFSWNRFNVYYASMIIFTWITAIALLFTLFQKNSESNASATSAQELLIPEKKSEVRNDTDDEKQKSEITPNKNFNKNQNITVKNYKIGPSTPADNQFNNVSNLEKTIDQSSVSEQLATQSIVDTAKKVPTHVILKRKKTVYLSTPQDTIYNIDTIKVKKRSKKQ